MTTITAHPRKTQGPDINGPAGALFAKVFAEVYLTANDDIKQVIESMSKIVNDPAADAEERNAALDTLVEVLFPPEHPEEMGVDLEEMQDGDSVEAKRVQVAMAHQEANFADAVHKMMKERGITQKALAEKIGIGQPAVSMILSRKCRPQWATVEKIAKALGIDPKALTDSSHDDDWQPIKPIPWAQWPDATKRWCDEVVAILERTYPTECIRNKGSYSFVLWPKRKPQRIGKLLLGEDNKLLVGFSPVLVGNAEALAFAQQVAKFVQNRKLFGYKFYMAEADVVLDPGHVAKIICDWIARGYDRPEDGKL